ncbi:MAG: T9SS type A sorting domain-containing protein [Bacteroidales bacterium]
MKKFTLLFLMLFSLAGVMRAQTVEDFESLKMNIMLGGSEDLSSFEVVPNPDPTGINTSKTVVKFTRDKDGVPWGGFYATLPSSIDVTNNKYVHVKVWKPRFSPVKFKLEGSVTKEIASIDTQMVTEQWEEFVFDFSTLTGDYTKIVFMPDFKDPVGLSEDIVIYFDDITINNDPTPGSAAVQVMENYEYIPLNLMTGGETDSSKMELVANPDPTGLNLSSMVIKFTRDKDGVPWGGFYSGTQVDVTTNKYVHVKVWKPRISPVKFKLEGGASGTLEIASTNTQTLTNAWEDMVFDFSAKTGTYPTIVFMPDFNDPVNLTEDNVIYFDDIIINNDPAPMTPPEQTISVDMRPLGMTAGDKVYISGAIGGIHGTWNEPGTNANNEMLDLDGDTIYSITMHLPNGVIAFKFFKNAGWGTGDPVGDRNLTVDGSMDLKYKWGVAGIWSGISNTFDGKVQLYPNPVGEMLNISSTVELSRVIITNMLGQMVGNFEMTGNADMRVPASGLNTGMYLVTVVGKDGSKAVLKMMKE